MFASHASVCFLLVLRTLVGHKANICSLDFHPYGEFVASGSQDTNIKVRPRTGPRVSRWPGSGTRPCVRPERVGVSSLSAAAALLLKIPSFNESSLDPCHLGCNDLEVPSALLCSQPHTALQPGPQDGPGSRPPQPQPPLVVTCSDCPSAPLPTALGHQEERLRLPIQGKEGTLCWSLRRPGAWVVPRPAGAGGDCWPAR